MLNLAALDMSGAKDYPSLQAIICCERSDAGVDTPPAEKPSTNEPR